MSPFFPRLSDEEWQEAMDRRLDEMFGPGIAERCYREGCSNWITGASDYCSHKCEEIAKTGMNNGTTHGGGSA